MLQRMLFDLGDCEIDADRRELKRGDEAIHVEPQVFDLLLYLLERRDRVVTKDELMESVWRGRVVSEATLSSRVAAARRAIGDSGREQARLRTVARRGFRFVGEVHERASPSATRSAGEVPSTVSAEHAEVPPQEVQFCRAHDGVRLAYAAVGSGPSLLKAANWLNHLEYDWRSPVWAPTFARLATDRRFIRYDGRGFGLSDWTASDLSFEAQVRDLATVADALELPLFPLLGISGGVPVAIAYAVRHPERVSRLVLMAGFARGWFRRGSAAEIAQREALIAMIRHGWGQDNPAFHQLFTALFVPGGTPKQHQWFKDLQRTTIPVDNAVTLARVFGEVDVTAVLPQVRAPTLLIHSRDDARVPFEQSLMMAREIPHARLVGLDSSNHIVLAHERAWHELHSEICTFLDVDR
jgi:DNA-binding winged helix-turn-helix (wHTH) protein/pimeloyl-ACP methyl ester carboxylesterase